MNSLIGRPILAVIVIILLVWSQKHGKDLDELNNFQKVLVALATFIAILLIMLFALWLVSDYSQQQFGFKYYAIEFFKILDERGVIK